MKNLVFAFALLCSTSLVAQFSFNANGTGIESPTNTASGNTSTKMDSKPKQVEMALTALGDYTTASGHAQMPYGLFNKSK